MAAQSPLNPLHQQAEASFMAYGPGAPGVAPMVVESFGELEGEYAALRKGCVLLDLPQRGTLRIAGKDRLDFLNRLVTQELKGFKPFQVRRSFWLNRKGRIDADLRLIELPEVMYADLDVLAASAAAKSLRDFVFSEAVDIADESEAMHRLALHGPTGPALVAAVSEHLAGPPLTDLGPGLAAEVRIASVRVLVDRADTSGETGLELLMPVEGVARVYEQLLERGLNGIDHAAAHPLTNAGYRLRPAGWHAYNIARIEVGTPLFNVDFGPESLPAETGVLSDRVSFTKGCYLGQEVVARMNALGHPKQVLVALRVHAPGAQPHAGSAVSRADDSERKPVGIVTSSTRSPMLGDAVIAFAQVRWGSHEPGTSLDVAAEQGPVRATVQRGLTFWSRDAA